MFPKTKSRALPVFSPIFLSNCPCVCPCVRSKTAFIFNFTDLAPITNSLGNSPGRCPHSRSRLPISQGNLRKTVYNYIVTYIFNLSNLALITVCQAGEIHCVPLSAYSTGSMRFPTACASRLAFSGKRLGIAYQSVRKWSATVVSLLSRRLYTGSSSGPCAVTRVTI